MSIWADIGMLLSFPVTYLFTTSGHFDGFEQFIEYYSILNRRACSPPCQCHGPIIAPCTVPAPALSRRCQIAGPLARQRMQR